MQYKNQIHVQLPSKEVENLLHTTVQQVRYWVHCSGTQSVGSLIRHPEQTTSIFEPAVSDDRITGQIEGSKISPLSPGYGVQPYLIGQRVFRWVPRRMHPA